MSVAVDQSSTSRMVVDQMGRLFNDGVTRNTLSDADAGKWQGGLWQQVNSAGIPLALVPEAKGGVGLEARDTMALVRVAGYHALPLPLAESIVARAVWSLADDAVDADPFPDLPWTLAPTRHSDRLGLQQRAGQWLLTGTAQRVPWVNESGAVVVSAYARDFEEKLVLVDTQDLRTSSGRNLANEPRDAVFFEDTAVPQQAVRELPALLENDRILFLLGALLRANQMVGAMERCLDYGLDYAKDRVQFGQPIARFPAVQSMLVQAAGECAAAAAAVDIANDNLNQLILGVRTSSFSLSVAIAKARASEGAGVVAAMSHQVLGALGFTQEHPLHYLTRRLWSWREEFGSEAYWQDEVGRAVCCAGGEALWPMLTVPGSEPR